MKDVIMKILIRFIYIVIFFFFNDNLFAKFKLITSLYNETNKARFAEYRVCLEKNLEHPLIDEVYVIYDTSKDDDNNELLKYLETKKVTISFVDGRPTYGHCFHIANAYFPNSNVIISNADIYFNDTLKFLESYNLSNKFLALTRWDVLPNGQLRLFGGMHYPRSDSQDVWIFRTPLRSFANDNIRMGLLDCDGRIAFQARQVGLQVINPCKTIQCCHLHLSNVRNYPERMGSYPKHEAILIDGITL